MQNKWPNKALHLTAIRLRPLGGMTTRVNGSTGFERMEGETNLSVLLAAMRPILHDEAYVFCVVDQDTYEKLPFTPLCTFREREGITVIVTQQQAEVYGLPFDSIWAYIELAVHSSLSAVGFLAVISKRLAQAGISTNVISAYYHDHLFVPWESREQAVDILQKLSLSPRT